MFCTSTHKLEWTFDSTDALGKKREQVNNEFREKYANVLQPGEEESLMRPMDESNLLSIVQETALKFGESFQPPLWPSVRWTAFAYFKRFYLKQSAMEFSPRTVMTACYYLATKTDEFYVTVEEFVRNLKSGTPEQNIQSILALEPEVMRRLNYSLVVHTPFRSLEGHFLEMKLRMVLLNFDIETLRQSTTDFLTKCLLTDAILMYAPSQIALASLMYSLNSNGKSPDILKEFLMKFFGIEDSEWRRNEKEMEKVDRLITQLGSLVALVEEQSRPVPQEARQECQQRYINSNKLIQVLEERRRFNNPPPPSRGDTFEDSDDEFA